MESAAQETINHLQTCLDKAHKLINPTRLEQSTPGDFLLQLESYVEEAGELSEMVRKWESNYIVERDNAEALRAELDKYRKLYIAVNKMVARLGADGEIETIANETLDVMCRLNDIDGGVPSDKNPGID